MRTSTPAGRALQAKIDEAIYKRGTSLGYEIAEGISGTWSYHWRRLGECRALCGASVMLTHAQSWGITTHLRERYCKECMRRVGFRFAFPAGLTIDPWAVAGCALKGHGTRLNGTTTRTLAWSLHVSYEAWNADFWDTPAAGASKPPLIAEIGRVLVRRLEAQCR